MLTVLVILAVLGILFGAAVLATYEGEVLRDPHPDDRDAGLPPTQLQPEDVAELRFDLALRGYRMAQVDDALARMGAELATRDARIAELEQALVEVVEPTVAPADVPASAPVDIAAEPVEQTQEAPVEVYEPLEPSTVAPAVISGPLTATTWFTEPAPEPVEEPGAVDVPPVASAPVDTPPAPEEQTQPEALVLPASDEAFSFPELHPPEPAAEPENPEQPSDWWTREPPDA